MALKACLLAYTKDFRKTSTATKGDDVTVTANAILLIPEAITDHYNIPTTEAVSSQVRQVIEQYTYTRYRDFTDTTGVQITVPEHERGGGSNTESAEKVVRIPHGSLKTSKGRPRTCSIRFPRFFNIIMIGQALGQMLKANEPITWKLDGTGKSYPFVKNTTTSLMTGYQSGAWVVTAPVTPTNADDTSDVGGTTVIKGRARKAAA